MKKILLLIFLLFGLSDLRAQTLTAGDIAFIGYNTAGADGFTFIALKNLPGGETLFFTEMGWTGAGWMNTLAEPHLKYVLPAGGVPKGTIISMVENSANVLTVTGIIGGTLTFANTADFNLSGGDQVLAYQSVGNVVMPSFADVTFIAGVHGDYNSSKYDSATKWNPENQSPTINNPWATSDSALPKGLTNGVNCISLYPGVAEQASAKYNGSLTGTGAELLARINNTSNWDKSNSNIAILPANYPTVKINTVPTAAAVAHTGNLVVGQVMAGSYTYSDVDSQTESGTTYKWYRSDNEAGLNKSTIASATSINYTLVAADVNKYISLEVTPRDGVENGIAIESSRRGPVSGVLPVDLENFRVSVVPNGLRLDWSTLSEADNKEFVLYRGNGNGSFSEVARIKGKGNSILRQTYSYVDMVPLNGPNYYRLVQFDVNGAFKDLAIGHAKFVLQFAMVKIYPNPVQEWLVVELEAGKYDILSVLDVQGKLLKEIALTQNQERIEVSLEGYAKGTYLIGLKGVNGIQHHKVVKK